MWPSFVSDSPPLPEDFVVNNNNSLQWRHVLQPSDLPPDFELVHDFIITYVIHVKYDRDDGVEAVTTVYVSGDRNYLNLNELDELDTCKRREFAIQAVINNELYSENRSIVSNLNGRYPCWSMLSE